MSSTPKVLVPGAFLPTGSPTMIYTSPANGRGTWVDVATATNDNVASQQFTMHRVPVGGGAAAENLIIKSKAVAAADTDLMEELRGKFLNPGDALYAFATTTNAITVDINGRELS